MKEYGVHSYEQHILYDRYLYRWPLGYLVVMQSRYAKDVCVTYKGECCEFDSHSGKLIILMCSLWQ